MALGVRHQLTASGPSVTPRVIMDHHRPSRRASKAQNVPLWCRSSRSSSPRPAGAFDATLPAFAGHSPHSPLRRATACPGPCGGERPTSPPLGQVGAGNSGMLGGGSSGLQSHSATIGSGEHSRKTITLYSTGSTHLDRPRPGDEQAFVQADGVAVGRFQHVGDHPADELRVGVSQHGKQVAGHVLTAQHASAQRVVRRPGRG